MVHRLVLSMQQKVFYQINGCYYKTRKIIGNQRQTATHSPTSHKCSRVRRKLQTIRETTFAMRGNIKPFGKRLSPCADTPNLLRNELREAHKGHKQKSVHLIAQMNALIKRRRLPTLPHCIAVPSAQVGLTSLFGMGRGGTPPQ